jgi:hypothetical protein
MIYIIRWTDDVSRFMTDPPFTTMRQPFSSADVNVCNGGVYAPLIVANHLLSSPAVNEAST